MKVPTKKELTDALFNLWTVARLNPLPVHRPIVDAAEAVLRQAGWSCDDPSIPNAPTEHADAKV